MLSSLHMYTQQYVIEAPQHKMFYPHPSPLTERKAKRATASQARKPIIDFPQTLHFAI